MATEQEILKAQNELEHAMVNFIRVSKGDTECNHFLQDYVCAMVSESMEPGKAGYSFFTFVAPTNRAKYAIRGLLDEANVFYKSTTRSENYE